MESKDLDHPNALTFGEFTLDPRRRSCFRGTDRVHLTPKAFETLLFLASNPGRVVSKKELLNAVWGGVRDESTVEHAVRQIRLALKEDKDHPRFLKTIPWHGYWFLSDVVPPTLVGGASTEEAGFLPPGFVPVTPAPSDPSTVPVGEVNPGALDCLSGEVDSPEHRLSRRTLLGGLAALASASAIGASLLFRPS